MLRKLCNLRCLLASLVLSIASSLRLNHAKPTQPALGHKRYRNGGGHNRSSFCNGINSSVRTCLMKDFDDEMDDELLSGGEQELDLTGGSGRTDDVQITPTLNNTVPTHTPTVRMMNSTPLNHNHAGMRMSFRNNNIDTPSRNMSFDSAEEDFYFSMDPNGSHRSEDSLLHTRHSVLHSSACTNDSSFYTKKKLFFKSDDSD